MQVGARACDGHGNRRRMYLSRHPRWMLALASPLPMSACTIVPLYPNELTPSVCRRPLLQSMVDLANCVTITPMQTCSASESTICGFRTRSCALGGAAILTDPPIKRIAPTNPAAGSAWPTFAFMLPIGKDSVSLSSLSTADPNERTSMGSPRGVPVPCAS
eukprot:scaffold11155_cov141-Isochrysis_galbana.AAC.1